MNWVTIKVKNGSCNKTFIKLIKNSTQHPPFIDFCFSVSKSEVTFKKKTVSQTKSTFDK